MKTSRGRSTGFRCSKSGKRADLNNAFFRSKMEANLARFWKFQVEHGELAAWEYELKEFEFAGHRRNNFYKPDFRLTFKTPHEVRLAFGGNLYEWIGCEYVWIEAKGFMDNDSRIRIERFLEFNRTEPLRIIDFKEYREIAKQVGKLCCFESENDDVTFDDGVLEKIAKQWRVPRRLK